MDSGKRVLVDGKALSLSDPRALEAEWDRLRLATSATRRPPDAARSGRSPLTDVR